LTSFWWEEELCLVVAKKYYISDVFQWIGWWSSSVLTQDSLVVRWHLSYYTETVQADPDMQKICICVFCLVSGGLVCYGKLALINLCQQRCALIQLFQAGDKIILHAFDQTFLRYSGLFCLEFRRLVHFKIIQNTKRQRLLFWGGLLSPLREKNEVCGLMERRRPSLKSVLFFIFIVAATD